MILHFRALHPHLKDDWLEASAGWNNNCFHTFYDSSDTGDAIDDSDLGREDGANCHTANLSCAIEEPAIHNTTDDVCHAVDVFNLFPLLPIEHASMIEVLRRFLLLQVITIPQRV